MMEKTFVCPCCGWQGLARPAYESMLQLPVKRGVEPPYSDHYGMPSYAVCGCCGFEYGFDDEPGIGTPSTFESYLEEWIKDGAVWFSNDKRPENWSLILQLDEAGIARLQLR